MFKLMTEKTENQKKPSSKVDKIKTETEKHICVFDREVATDVYLNTPATATQKATYFKSCICTGKGTETFEYGELLKAATESEEAAVTESEEEAFEETVVTEKTDVTGEKTETGEEETEDAVLEVEVGEEIKEKSFPMLPVVLVIAVVAIAAVGVVLVKSKKKA